MSERLERAKEFNRRLHAHRSAIPELLGQVVANAASDANAMQKLASTVSAVTTALDVREWQTGMYTAPGDAVWDPGKKNVYIFSQATGMTHANPTFYPGATGVYYWLIIPNLKDGCPVFPNKTGIVVFVKKNSVWWDPQGKKRYTWTGEDYYCPANFYPGAAGVHQWVTTA